MVFGLSMTKTMGSGVSLHRDILWRKQNHVKHNLVDLAGSEQGRGLIFTLSYIVPAKEY